MKFRLPNKEDVSLGIILYLLNVVDAFFTIYWIGNGAIELNPLMAFFINLGTLYFLIVKIPLAAVMVAILLACSRKSHVKSILLFLTGMYTMLLLIHVLSFAA